MSAIVAHVRGTAITIPGFVFNDTITGSMSDYNLRSRAIAAGWDAVKALIATVTVNSGAVLGASATNTYGFRTGASFPTGSQLWLVNNGYIVGKGGNGGTSGSSAGQSGGTALLAEASISITNNGTIGGGGGGGGGGAGAGASFVSGYSTIYIYAGGGGGGGGAGSAVGAGGGGNTTLTYVSAIRYATNGGAGTLTGAGGGGQSSYGTSGPNLYTAGGPGGNGGGLGAAGGSGGGASYGGEAGYAGTVIGWYGATGGGAGGAAVSGNSFINWLATGTRLGAIA